MSRTRRIVELLAVVALTLSVLYVPLSSPADAAVIDSVVIDPPPRPTGWHESGPVTVTVSASDTANGIQRLEWGTGTTGAWTVFGEYAAPYPVNVSGSVVFNAPFNSTLRFRAIDGTGVASPIVRPAVRIDGAAPTLAWPGIIDGRVGSTATLIPTQTDPISGGSAVLNMYLDGDYMYPLPIETYKLLTGLHEVTVELGDTAGNAATYTNTFLVTTTFAETQTNIARYATSGEVTPVEAADLTALLAAASAAADAGNARGAADLLKPFTDRANALQSDLVRRRLVDAADFLRGMVRGAPLPVFDPTQIVGPGESPERVADVSLVPVPEDPDADFNVLVFTETTGFRHDHIPHTVFAIQQLATENNFNVDVYDPQLPSVSIATNPFLTAEALEKYDTIVFASTVGHNPGPLEPTVEQPNFTEWVRAGGGYVGIHGAADAHRGSVANRWEWYGSLVGGWFLNHPSGRNGFINCGSCIQAQVNNEDPANATVAHIPTEWTIIDELYNFDRNMRGEVHTLLSLDEESYRRSLNIGNAANTGQTLMGGDHPIAWCQVYEGGRAWSNILGHNRPLYYDDLFVETLRQGILWTAGQIDTDCSSYGETAWHIAQQGGDETAAGLLEAARTAYLARDYDGAVEALRLLGDRATVLGDAELHSQAATLARWMKRL